MNTIIRKWGNSPTVKLSAASMKTAAFELEQRVTITATKGRIVIEAADTFEFNLNKLIKDINPQNLHEEIDFDSPVGLEKL